MDYPLKFITWLEDHDDLCNEQFHSLSIPEYLKGNIEWYPVISFHMGCEIYDGDGGGFRFLEGLAPISFGVDGPLC